MNQPSSRCHGWVDQLVQIGELVDDVASMPKKGPTRVASPDSPAGFEGWNSPNYSEHDAMDVDPPQQSLVEEYPGAAATYNQERKSFLQHFDQDQFAEQRCSNLYYPFGSRADWELGLWLTRSGLSMAAIDSLLSLGLVSRLPSHVFDVFSWHLDGNTSYLVSNSPAVTWPRRATSQWPRMAVSSFRYLEAHQVAGETVLS